MKAQIVVSDTAKDDFKDLMAFLRENYSENAANKLRSEYKGLLSGLSDFPLKFPSIPSNSEFRKAVLLRKTIVYYRFAEGIVTILSIRDGRRQNLRR